MKGKSKSAAGAASYIQKHSKDSTPSIARAADLSEVAAVAVVAALGAEDGGRGAPSSMLVLGWPEAACALPK